jgi:acyl-CoA oxidase
LAELHALISVIKPLSSWTAYACVHEARKSCGGLGYSFYSRFSESLAGCDINCTWEGDNNVLLQQTAKYLLDCYKAKMKQKGKPTITCEWITLDDVTEEKCKAETIEDFLQPENLKKIFEYRCNKLL